MTVISSIDIGITSTSRPPVPPALSRAGLVVDGVAIEASFHCFGSWRMRRRHNGLDFRVGTEDNKLMLG